MLQGAGRLILANGSIYEGEFRDDLRHGRGRLTTPEGYVYAGDWVADFVGLYERHIAREESELLPMAQRLLSDAELDRIGLAMRVRRNAVDSAETLQPQKPEQAQR